MRCLVAFMAAFMASVNNTAGLELHLGKLDKYCRVCAKVLQPKETTHSRHGKAGRPKKGNKETRATKGGEWQGNCKCSFKNCPHKLACSTASSVQSPASAIVPGRFLPWQMFWSSQQMLFAALNDPTKVLLQQIMLEFQLNTGTNSTDNI